MLSDRREDFSEEDFLQTFNQPKHRYIQVEKFTSDYYNDLTQENNIIGRAFQSNNYTYIRQLPNNFKHNRILNNRLQKARELLDQEKVQLAKTYSQKLKERGDAVEKKKMEPIGNLGYFEAFTYKGTEYDYAKDLIAQQKKYSQMNRKKISDMDFRPSDKDYKAKYEDPFQFKDKAFPDSKRPQEYLFPFNIPSDTYCSFHQSVKRQKIVNECARLAGPFLPSMQQKTLTKVQRSQINEILKDIESYISKHIKQPYILAVTIRDHIQLMYQEKHRDDLKIKTIMSMICQNESLSKYQLKRQVRKWGVVDGDYVCYSIVPPWVMFTVKDTPEQGTAAQITKILGEMDHYSGAQK